MRHPSFYTVYGNDSKTVKQHKPHVFLVMTAATHKSILYDQQSLINIGMSHNEDEHYEALLCRISHCSYAAL